MSAADMDEDADRCALDGCAFVATQGEFCLTHRELVPSKSREPMSPRTAEYVARVVADAPPLSIHHAARIALLLRGGGAR